MKTSNLHLVRGTRRNPEVMPSAIPMTTEVALQLAGYSFYLSFDLKKAYFQTRVSTQHCIDRAFHWPGHGTYRFNNCLPLGDNNGPTAFTLFADTMCGPLRKGTSTSSCSQNYFDDAQMGTNNVHELLPLLEAFGYRMSEVNATFKLDSLRIGFPYSFFAGFRVDNEGLHAPTDPLIVYFVFTYNKKRATMLNGPHHVYATFSEPSGYQKTPRRRFTTPKILNATLKVFAISSTKSPMPFITRTHLSLLIPINNSSSAPTPPIPELAAG